MIPPRRTAFRVFGFAASLVDIIVVNPLYDVTRGSGYDERQARYTILDQERTGFTDAEDRRDETRAWIGTIV